MFETRVGRGTSIFGGRGIYLSRNRFTRNIRSATLPLLTVIVLGSGNAQAFCLDPAYQYAVVHDPRYLQAQSEYDAARQKFPQARALMLPQATAQLEWGRYGTHANLFGVDVSGTSKAAYGAAQVTQALFNVPYLYDMRRATEFEASAKQKLEVAKQDLILRVANACFDLLSAREKLQSADDEVSALTRLESDTRRMAQLGMKTIGDTAEIEARRSLAQSDEVLAQTDVDARRAR